MALSLVAPDGVFPFGTHVYREPARYVDQILDDLPALRASGFTMIKIQQSWSTNEPAEGKYDFGQIERVMEGARDAGLGVYLGLTMEQAPAWVWRKYPDAYMVDDHGRPHLEPNQYCLPADGKPGPCWDHPGFRAAGERFITEIASTLGRYDNLWVWNTFQEIGFWPNDAGVLGFCYCDYTLNGFREWLAQKYVTLDELNKTWGTAYSDWEDIEPPRRYAARPPTIDWRYYMDDVYMSRALEWKTAALKAADPKHRPVFAHVGHAGITSGSEWRWTQVADFFGTSNYPAWHPHEEWDDPEPEPHWSHLAEVWSSLMLENDIVRNANGRRPFWGAEFQGGPVSTFLHLGRKPAPADIRRWTLAGLATGMTGISFWNHRAEDFWHECNGFGLMDRIGTTTDRYEEAGRIGRALNAEAEFFTRSAPPPAQVAIVLDEDLHHFCQASGDAGQRALPEQLLRASVRGHYARLWRLGVPVDFVELSLARPEQLDAYKAIILPVPLAIDSLRAKMIIDYVHRGGTVISDACPGRFDKYGFCTPTQMFDGAEDLFGARQAGLTLVAEPNEAHWTPKPRGIGEIIPPIVLAGDGDLAGTSVRASFYVQTFEPTTSTAALRYGDQVAGVVNKIGAGTAVLLGTFVGLCAVSHRHEPADGFIYRLLNASGVERDGVGPLLRRRRVLDEREAWFLINPTDAPVTHQVSIGGATDVRDLLDGPLLISASGDVSVEIPAAGICCLLVDAVQQ